jgi:hypothetical protein
MSLKLLKVCSVAVLVLLVFAALGPAKWIPRSGLGWRIDHFVGYFAFTLMFCLAWPRPLVIGGGLMALAVLLECLQAFTPDRHADLHAALISAGGAMAAVLPAHLLIQAPRRLNGQTLLMLQGLSWPSRSSQLPAFLRLRSGAPRRLATVRALSNSEISPSTLRRRV